MVGNVKKDREQDTDQGGPHKPFSESALYHENNGELLKGFKQVN